MPQLYAVAGMPYRRRDQVSQVNAALPFLSQRMGLQSQRELQDATIKDMAIRRKLEEARFGIEQSKFGLAKEELGLKERQIGLEEKGLSLQERGLSQQEQQYGWQRDQAQQLRDYNEEVEKRQMGIKAAGLGFTALTSAGNTTLGDITGKIGGLWGSLFGKEQPQQLGIGATQPMQSTPGAFSSLPIGSMVGGGAVGFGAGQAFGGKNKLNKSLIGAGVGGLTSFLSSGDWGAAIGGGILGGLGGLF